MQAWVDYAARAAATGRHESRVARSAEPAPHERYLWDTGWHFGEWLEAGEIARGHHRRRHGRRPRRRRHRLPPPLRRQLAEIARILGRRRRRRRATRELAAHVADAWRTEFLADDGTTTPDTQATYARALTFGLVPDHLRGRVGATARRARSGPPATTSRPASSPPRSCCPVLADTGHLDVAYDLLFQDTEPSWLVMVDRGATTVWEEWGGVDADGVPHASLNHYSKGAVITFLHQYVAGLQLVEPGYRRFRVAPRPGGGLTWAEARHDSPHGPIEVRWDRDGDRIDLRVTVPPGTTAEIELPGATAVTVGPGQHTMST